MDVVTTSNIDGGTESTLNDDLKSLYSPLESNDCPKSIYVSIGKIKRIDLTNSPELIIKAEDNLKTWIQKKTSGRDNLKKRGDTEKPNE